MEQNGERRGVGCEDDDLADATVEGLGSLVGAFLQLAVVRRLLDQVEDLLRECLVGNWPGCGFCHFRRFVGVRGVVRVVV